MGTRVKTGTVHGTELVLESEKKPTSPPPLFRVLLLNDDYTPMDFVVMVLQRFFSRTLDDAITIMLQVHHEGRGVCGVYPKDIAQAKVRQVSEYAKANGHPLVCKTEVDNK